MIRVATFVLAMLCGVGWGLNASAQPNVVILLADDLGWADVGYHRSATRGTIETPGIDRLAREGVRLERFYSAPICSPTRAALMTGRDPLKLGIGYDQLHPWYNAGLAPDTRTIADVFRAAGYATAIVGKWHLGHSQPHQLPNAQGFDHFWGHLHTNTDYFTHEREGGHDLQQNGRSVHEPGKYLTRLEAREAVRFLREREQTKPFFLYVPFTAPHSPMQAPKETIEQHASLPAAGNRRVYAAMVDEMDRAIVAILDTLDQQGIADDTLVLFFSDNGGYLPFGADNSPLKGMKGQTFEGGIRVPAVVRWPARLEAGREMNQLMTVMDVMPTLARAAGAAAGSAEPIDGQDMWRAISEGVEVPRSKPVFFVSEIPIPGLIHTAVLDEPWKLVQIVREGHTETKVRSFLYEIENDPNEQQDVAAKHPEQVKRLAAQLASWRRQHPMAGTRSTLVPHPGWVAPKDWADAVPAASLLQSNWKNELPFSKELLDATAQRGVLVDEETRQQLIQAEKARLEAEK